MTLTGPPASAVPVPGPVATGSYEVTVAVRIRSRHRDEVREVVPALIAALARLGAPGATARHLLGDEIGLHLRLDATDDADAARRALLAVRAAVAATGGDTWGPTTVPVRRSQPSVPDAD